MKRGKPIANADLGCQLYRFLCLLQRHGWQMFLYQRLGAVEQDAGGFDSFFITDDLAVFRVWCIFCNACCLQSLLIGPGSKPVKPSQIDWIIRCGITQCLVVRIMSRPFAFVPSPTENPLAARRR